MKPPRQLAIAEACSAQSKIVEAVEALAVPAAADLEAAEALLHGAMIRLVAARSAVLEARRERDGVPSIGSTARVG